MKFDLAVVVPTLNEVGNVEPLYEKLCATLEGIAWEVIYVDDDSKDGTLDVLAALQTKHANVRYIRRVGRRGLASASIEGMMASSAPYLAVMDADLQHDETLLPQMLSVVRDDGYDIVSASRFLEGSKLEGLSKMRTRMSQVGIGMVNWLLRAKLTDPLTGFFLLRRDVLNEVVYDLSQQGFKILVDIFASAKRPLKAKEVPMTFRERHSGASKLDLMVLFEFLTLLSDKTIGAVIPTRFIMFVLVGLTGVGVHVGVLGLVHKVMALDFWLGQSAAVIVAMSTNFYLNNVFTYRDRKLKGADFFKGLVTFYIVCSVGFLVSVVLGDFLNGSGVHWLLAGIIGSVVGSVWNYGVSSTFTWKKAKKPDPEEDSSAAKPEA